MRRKLAYGAFIAGLAITAQSMAQTDSTPGVKDVAPGVREVDGAKVPSVGVDTAALEANIKEKHSFAAAKALLGGGGIDSIGPAGTTVHMYKVHDTVTAHDFVVLLFIKDGSIVDYLMTDTTKN